MAAPAEPAAEVRRVLQSYARRGVFRSFSQTDAGDRRIEFRFDWLWNLPFRLTFDRKLGWLAFNGLLRDIRPGSELDADLRKFIRSFSTAERPEHRRIDPSRVAVRYSNRRGAVGLTFRILDGGYEYGVKKAVNLVHEIFLSFLNVDHPQYLIDHFRIAED
ncbi:MAG: hypothetical protein ACRD8O_05225 [Bryobacteraceae bacterium]